MHRTVQRVAVLVCLLLPAAAAARADVTIVDDGKSEYVIVVAKDASPSEKFAAEELQSHIKQMSGAELPIQVRGDAVPDKAITLGLGAAPTEFHPPIELGVEGYLISTRGSRLIILGSEKRGTLYGVYTLLEKLGVRWWYPGETTIPQRKTVTVPEMDLSEEPKLQTRNIMYAEGFSEANHIWFVRNKLNGIGWQTVSEKMGGGTLSAGLQGHSSIDYVEAGAGEMTPEMWALVKGERSKAEICPSNDQVVAAAVKALAKAYKEHPETPYLVLSHEDNGASCRCEACTALAEKHGPSGPWWQFINRVADGLEKEVPGARLMSSAYMYTRTPPKDLPLRHNVIVRFAPIEADFFHPIAAASNPENAAIKADITAWGGAAKAMMIWTYVGNRAHYLMPNPDLDVLVPNIKFFADNRAVGITVQGTHVGRGTEFAPLRMWVLARALWNPDADGRALVDEFVKGYYGPAAPAVAEYIDLMHRWPREHAGHLGRVTRMNAPFLTPETMAEAEVILRKAAAAVAGNADLERRVRHAHMPVWYVLAKRGPMSLTWKAVEKRVGKLDFAQIAARMNHVAKDYGINAVADPENAAPFFEWLTDYGRLLKERGHVLPPELAGKDLETVRLLQARQIDSGWLGREGWWVRDEAASDGWALKVPTPRWLIQHYFSPVEEIAGAKRFRLFVRVRGGELSGQEGAAFVCGIGGGGAKVEPAADGLADGKYHVFDVGEFGASDNVMMYIALARPGAMKEVYLDCLWLKPVE